MCAHGSGILQVKSLLRQLQSGPSALTAVMLDSAVLIPPDAATVINSFLAGLVTLSPANLSNGFALQSYCRLVANYSVWITGQVGLTDSVVALLVQALRVPSASSAAAQAIRNLRSVCVRASTRAHLGFLMLFSCSRAAVLEARKPFTLAIVYVCWWIICIRQQRHWTWMWTRGVPWRM